MRSVRLSSLFLLCLLVVGVVSVFVLPVKAVSYQWIQNGTMDEVGDGWGDDGEAGGNATYGWTYGNGGSMHIETDNYHSSPKSHWIQQWFSGQWLNTSGWGVERGDILSFSVWCKVTGVYDQTARVTIWYANGTSEYMEWDVITNTAWSYRNLLSMLDSGVEVVKVQLQNMDGGNSLYFDDCSLLATVPRVDNLDEDDVDDGSWVTVPGYVDFIVLFCLVGLPGFVLGIAGSKGGWGLQGLLFGAMMGLGIGVWVGLVPFWFIFLLGLFMVIFMYSLAKRS